MSSPIGINTNEAMDIGTSIPFIDLFKLSLPFEEARPWLTKGKIIYDTKGWPKVLTNGKAGTRFVSNIPAETLPKGDYTVLYDGDGLIEYGVGAKLLKHSEGKDIIKLVPDRKGLISATITITKSDTKNYVRNIRILMPGGICQGDLFKRVKHANECGDNQFLSFEKNYQKLTFNPDYLHFMKDFKVLRFMNMSGITRNSMRFWRQRATPTDASWAGKEGVRGVPVEIMVELTNILKSDAWFTLPHKADNYFIHKYAEYVHKNLKPGLKAYVEYSNETWNGIFPQAHYMKRVGEKMKLDPNRDYAGYKFYSKRSVEIFKIWEKVFGDTKRFVRVMGGMTGNMRLTKMLLEEGDAYKHTDALAIAPYFYAPQNQLLRLRSVDSVFKILEDPQNPYSIKNILDSVTKQAELSKHYGVDLVAYEGGQHLVAYRTHTMNAGPNPYLIAANRDPRMAEFYYKFLRGWKQAGGKLFVAFSAPRKHSWFGSWGIKEYITQPMHKAPKYRALMQFVKNNICWWKGCSNYGPVVRHKKLERVAAK
jgi:hypothetical protein